MSVCWKLVCDATQEKLWCGQNDMLYIKEEGTMRDLSAFLYRNRGHSFRVVDDLSWGGPEDDYLEVGNLYGDWEVYAYTAKVAQYLGVFGGSLREALADAAEIYFPDCEYFENTNVLDSKDHDNCQLAVSWDLNLDKFEEKYMDSPRYSKSLAPFMKVPT